MTDLPSNAPSPRLCHIVKWPDFDGYGFNLHADKNRPGQYIGKVDDNSPADVAGLREGDRIIEVNGVNISNENHKQVVQRIKAVLNETKLLVVDNETDQWYKSHNLVVRGDQPNIIHGSSQRAASESPPSVKTPTEEKERNGAADEDSKSVGSTSSSHSDRSSQPQPAQDKDCGSTGASDQELVAALKIYEEDTCKFNSSDDRSSIPDGRTSGSPRPTDSDLTEYDNVRFEQEENTDSKSPVEERRSVSSHSSSRSYEDAKPDNVDQVDNAESLPDTEPDQDDKMESPMSTTPSPPPSVSPESITVSQAQNSTTTKPATVSSGLNLNMTAAEMRAHLASKKKFDPRKDSIDLKKKYQIVQNM